MLKFRSTRKAMLLSILAVVVCLAAFGGASFALFTYEEPAANLIVNAGDVAVDMQDASGTSLAGQALPFRDKNGNTNIQWEPGARFLSDAFYVKNVGDVKLNFRILLEGAGMDNAEFLEAFEVMIVDAQGQTVDLSKYQQQLVPGQSAGEFRISAKMKGSAGNEYQNRRFNGVSVTVYAIQGSVDAFTETPMS